MRGDFYMLIFIGFLVVFNLGLAAYIGAGGMPDMPEDAALFLAFFTLLPLVTLCFPCGVFVSRIRPL